MKKGDVLELEIIDMASSSQGIAKYNSLVIFVNGAVLGDRVNARISLKKKNYAVSNVVSIIEPSDKRKDDMKFVIEGQFGLALRPLKYEHELKFKEEMLDKLRKKHLKGLEIKQNQILYVEDDDRYRNKGIYPVKNSSPYVLIGSYERGTHNVIDESDNPVMPKSYAEIITCLREFFYQEKLDGYDEISKKGEIKYIIIRSNKKNEHMLAIVARKFLTCNFDKLYSMLNEKNINIVSLYQSSLAENKNTPSSGLFKLERGQDYLDEKLLGRKFRYGIRSFFQVNTNCTEILYSEAKRMIGDTKEKTIWDIYCGVGSIAQAISDTSSKIIGNEIEEEAVKFARENAVRNGFKNAEYHAKPAEKLIPKLIDKNQKADIIILDPPRKGVGEKVLEKLVQAEAEKILYISCNPSSLMMDIKYLISNGYKVDEMTPVDMFKWTSHVESIALLSKLDGDKQIN